jgi:hypothetical protein
LSDRRLPFVWKESTETYRRCLTRCIHGQNVPVM